MICSYTVYIHCNVGCERWSTGTTVHYESQPPLVQLQLVFCTSSSTVETEPWLPSHPSCSPITPILLQHTHNFSAPHGTTFQYITQGSRLANFDGTGRSNTCMTSSWYIALPIGLSCLSSSHSWGTHCSGVPCCNHAPKSGISWIRWDSFLKVGSLQA